MYLVGEPIFEHGQDRSEFYAPAGQAELCLNLMRGARDPGDIIDKLRKEYVDIVYSLKKMGIDFRIAYGHRDLVDERTLAICAHALQCRFADIGHFAPSSTIYPRDFATILSGLVLVNHKIGELLRGEGRGFKLLSSPFGEGGRIMFTNSTALISERVIEEQGGSRDVTPEEIKSIENTGMGVGLAPMVVTQIFTLNGLTERFTNNDHIDRWGALLSDGRGDPHLIVNDPLIIPRWREGKWTPISDDEALGELRSRFKPLGMTVHRVPRPSVPYSLNMVQFPDRRVLMTAGEPELEEQVKFTVGRNNVYTTEEPIQYLPTWQYAGIRCMIAPMPTPLFKPM